MRRPAAVALVAALAMVATACPAGSGDPDPTQGATDGAVPTPTPVKGGTLAVAVRDLESFDPAAASGRGALNAVSHVFEPLTAIDPVTNRVVPGAAERWTVSQDGLTWRFHLGNRRFHDGTRVRAQDFKFAFDRLTRSGTHSDAAFQLEQVRGFRAVKIDGTRSGLTGVVARNRDLLVIRLARPFSELAYHLAHPALVPLPRAYRDSMSGIRRSPIGNGAFRVEEASARRALLVPFERWAGAEPNLDAIEYRVVNTIDAGWRRFREGVVQVAEVPPTAIDGGTSLYGLGGFTPFWATLSFGFNTTRTKFRRPEVRRAISLAIDREAIAATVYGNTRDPATGILPAGIRGYIPGACETCVQDLDRAQEIVDGAFGQDKPRIGIDFLRERSSRQVARTIAADLERLGFRVNLRPHGRNRYLRVLEGGEHDLAQLGWLSDVPSPDPFLHQQLRTGQINNHTGWSRTEFDRLLDRARRTRGEAARLDLYIQAERIALRAMPLMPIVFFRNRTAVAPNVHGLELDGAGLFDGTAVWIQP